MNQQQSLGSGQDSSSQEGKPASPQEPKPARKLGLWLRDMLFSLLVSIFIITFLYQPVKVEGTSMLPRLEDQDRLFINKFAYHFEKIERGDVVVFYYPRDPQKSYIKRVIALPGDDLRIDSGQGVCQRKVTRRALRAAPVSGHAIAGRDGDSTGRILRDG